MIPAEILLMLGFPTFSPLHILGQDQTAFESVLIWTWVWKSNHVTKYKLGKLPPPKKITSVTTYF